MAVPGSGEISLGKIRQELQAANYTSGPYTAASTSLDLAENGTYATINTCSPYYPLSANPANMSEWYGYDHDAVCSFSSGSYYDYDGGLTSGHFILNGTDLTKDPESKVQVDLTDKFTLSMWVQPGAIDRDGTHPEYARYYPLWEWYDNTNDYYVMIGYDPYYSGQGGNTFNQIYFSIGAVGGGNRVWTIRLDDTTNSTTTGVDDGSAWAYGNDNLGNTNSREFINLIFVYDGTQTGIDQFRMYWNGSTLTTTAYSNAGGPSGITFSNTSVNVGYSPFYDYEWFGHIDWVSYANQFGAADPDASGIWNSGTPLGSSDLSTNISSNFAHWPLNGSGGSGVDPEVDELFGLEIVWVGAPSFSTGIHA